MKRAQSRQVSASTSKLTSSPGRGAFGAFSAPTAGSNLSYLSEVPDFTVISDPNIVVSFKNVLKKDGTTKAKGLEDIIAHIRSHPAEDGGIEEAVLDSWVAVYPRTAIDNARRVRELSHSLQYEAMKSARKRMERRLPAVAGTWLAGTFDRDRGVAKVAGDGLGGFLDSEEKGRMFWRKLAHQVLEYATDAMMETVGTLSDERSITKDDAEAVYFRVVAGALSLALGLLRRLEAKDVEAQREAWEKFLGLDALWKSITATDGQVRKAALQLLLKLLEDHEDLIDGRLAHLSKIMIAEGLKSNQSGSATEFVLLLTELTSRRPAIWEAKEGKAKTPLSRLQHFLEDGSQGGLASFWRHLSELLATLPSYADVDDVSRTLAALRKGMTLRSEPRSNLKEAWTCYLAYLERAWPPVAHGSAEEARFLEGELFPLTGQYLAPSPENAQWNVGDNMSILIESWRIFLRKAGDLQRENGLGSKAWSGWANTFRERMSNSLPEVSEKHAASQRSIADEGRRWFTLIGALSELDASGETADAFTVMTDAANRTVLNEAAELLIRRNYKPFGLAAIFEMASRHAPRTFDKTSFADRYLPKILPEDDKVLETALSSSSADHIVACTAMIDDNAIKMDTTESWYTELWQRVAIALTRLPLNQSHKPLQRLLSSRNAATLAQGTPGLQALLQNVCAKAIEGDHNAWKLFELCFSSDILPMDVRQNLTKTAVRGLVVTGSHASSLKAMEIIMVKQPSLVTGDEALELDLTGKMLAMMEFSDISEGGPSPRTDILAFLRKQNNASRGMLVSVIQKQLDTANEQSLEPGTLAQPARTILEEGEKASIVERAVSLAELLPDTNIWMAEFRRSLPAELDPSLSLVTRSSGALFLAGAGITTSNSDSKPKVDRHGLSIPIRMALYTLQILDSQSKLASLPADLQSELLILLGLIAEQASDEQALSEAHLSDIILSRIGQLASDTQILIAEACRKSKGFSDPLISGVIKLLLQQSHTLDVMGVYSARLLTTFIESLIESHGGPSDLETWLADLGVLKATSSTVLGAVALLNGLGEHAASSKTVINLCNRLVSDVAGLNIQSDKTLLTLFLLNACLTIFGLDELPVANNRVVFAVRQLTSWLENPLNLDYRLSAEVSKALGRLLPAIKDVYGPYWERTLDFCIYLWQNAGRNALQRRLPYLHASLKLYTGLESLTDANDDLEDALKAHAEQRSSGLVSLLELPRRAGADSQPAKIVDELLLRQVRKIPLQHIKDMADLYGLLASESRDTQTAAFDLLHRALPAAQEQLSVDILLDKKTGRLPSELLSLLLDAPTLERYPEEVLATFPLPIRSYLLSWELVFDAFSKAAHKLRTDYRDNLKEANHLPALLDFMFDVLGHSGAHPLNLDRAGFTEDQIRSYDITIADTEEPERNMQWLLVNLFFNVLRYVPGLFKTWFNDTRSKQTTIAVEAWMAKYFSPLIIADALDEVSVWSTSPEAKTADEDDVELLVKILPRAKEVMVGYEVDEQTASATIKLPDGFPKDQVTVVGNRRVAVNQDQWNGWLRHVAGVINFPNGGLIEGLLSFRRSVSRALKGQSECSICYSIISEDQKLPDKRCRQCRNMFHNTCLYKWFRTSAGHSCPLCRTDDMFGRD
jgi:E3 ubiquitin-protein ligase listerin